MNFTSRSRRHYLLHPIYQKRNQPCYTSAKSFK